MMRINLLPPSQRASLRTVQLGTVLLIIGIVYVAVLSFASVYLCVQVANERERLEGYQATVASIARYRSEITRLEREANVLTELAKPFAEQLAANQPAIDLTLLFRRTVSAAQAGHVWLRELSVQKDGSTPVIGYAVEFSEVTRFLDALGREPFHVVMGATRWGERGGVKVVEFNARVNPIPGGVQP